MYQNVALEPFWKVITKELLKQGYSSDHIAKILETPAMVIQELVESENQPQTSFFNKLYCLYFREFYCNVKNPQSENWQRFRQLRKTAGLPNDWMELA